MSEIFHVVDALDKAILEAAGPQQIQIPRQQTVYCQRESPELVEMEL